jgi:hypothetical protein
MASGGTLSLAVVGSQEFAWSMVCLVSQLSTLMCVIPASKGSLMQGGGSPTKLSMESRKKNLVLFGGCWKVWKMFNFTLKFSNLIFIILVLQFMFALAVAKKGRPRITGIIFVGLATGSISRTMKSMGK